MSHQIEENDRQDGFTQAWHGLTNIKPDLSLQSNWLREWDVAPFTLQTENGAKSRYSILMATDNPTLIVGAPFDPKSYKVVTNAEFLRIADFLMAKFPGCKLVTAGSIRNRSRVFLSIELPKDSGGVFVAGGREFHGFFNLLNSFDLSSPVMGAGSTYCVVCDNTFSSVMAAGFADDGTNAAIGRHTKKLNLDTLARSMSDCIGAQLGFKESFDRLNSARISKDSAQWAFAAFVGERRAALTDRSAGIVNDLTALFMRGKGNKGETLGDWFSAVTDYYTHASAGGTDKRKQFLSSEFGTGARTKAHAWFLVTHQDRLAKLEQEGKDLWESYLKGSEAKVAKLKAAKAAKAAK